MLKREQLHNYQKSCVEFIKHHKKCGLFLDMGLGKTTTTLTAAADMIRAKEVSNVLVIAPLRVANTVWHKEAASWEHLKDLDVCVCTGTPKQRKDALSSDADIHVINRENVQWMVANVPWKWNMVIIDESSSFKSYKSGRFKSLRRVIDRIDSMVLLTGTPSPNGLMDLWPQLFLIDKGERLGKSITNYRQRFFYQTGYGGYTYEPREGAAEQIKRLIKDVCITMTAEDYLELPDKVVVDEVIELPSDAMRQYKELKKEFILQLEDGLNIETPSAAAQVNKLLQLCNGAVYDEEGNWHEIHDAKIKALKEIIEDNPTENLLVAYNFKSDLARLQAAFPDAVVLDKEGKALEEWNKGNIKMLLAHPASAGHGLNAQHGGSMIVWFGLNWSLELYQQFNARLHRQGQTKPVRIIRLAAKDCIDNSVLGVLRNKDATQDDLIQFLKYILK